MFSKLVETFVLLCILITVESNDIMVGRATPFSRKIYGTIKEANPALWTRTDDIMINAPYHDYISAVYVTDLRPDKEGEAYIAAGGIGSKTVTIALQSPSILRGYKFSIEVYAESISTYLSSFGRQMVGGGLSGYGSYPNTYSISSATYPIGQVQYPGGYSQSQYPLGR